MTKGGDERYLGQVQPELATVALVDDWSIMGMYESSSVDFFRLQVRLLLLST